MKASEQTGRKEVRFRDVFREWRKRRLLTGSVALKIPCVSFTRSCDSRFMWINISTTLFITCMIPNESERSGACSATCRHQPSWFPFESRYSPFRLRSMWATEGRNELRRASWRRIREWIIVRSYNALIGRLITSVWANFSFFQTRKSIIDQLIIGHPSQK
jgi:hypothetical protein